MMKPVGVIVVVASCVSIGAGFTSARIREVLGALVHERQELRRQKARASILEANRLAIVYWQQRLARQLLDEHPGPKPARTSS
jgi:hypothetical protein